MKILVFTEGTIIMHHGAIGLPRESVHKQVVDGEDLSIRDWKTYVPIGNAVGKLQSWKRQGAEIFYLTSRTKPSEIEDIDGVLKRFGFPEGQLLFREKGEQYKDVAERIMPDFIVEDDCVSIGGEVEMTYTYIKPELKKRIKCLTVNEFGGIDHFLTESKTCACVRVFNT
jgi:hypothetical protein